MIESPQIKVARVWRRFSAEGIPALSDINLTVRAGEFVCLLGPSGSGKSTLLNILGCLDRPSRGELTINGQDIWSLPPKEIDAIRRRTFGFIFQKYALIAALDVKQNIELPGTYARLANASRSAIADELLARFGLNHRTRQKPNLLSGGEQQRVAIARALFNRPQVILADEPTGALDSENGQNVIESLQQLKREGHTVVLVTHDLNLAAFADRVVTLKDGRIVSDVARETGSVFSQSGISTPEDSRAGDGLAIVKSAIGMGLTSIVRNKLQSGLTMLGVAIGVGAVFAMLTIGAAGNRQVIKNIEGLGADIVTLSRGPPGVRGAERTVVSLIPPDIDTVRQVSGVLNVTPEMDGVVLARYRDRDFLVTATGTDENFPKVRDWPMRLGGFFSSSHLNSHSPIVVLGATARDNLFPGEVDPIGQHILINRAPFLIVGVMVRKGVTTGPGHDRDNQIWLPYTTAGSRLFGRTYLDRIVAKIERTAVAEVVKSSVQRALLTKHRVEDFSVVALAEVIKMAERTQRTLNWLLATIAALALTIAAVGVMNMMLSSVSERVGEIGIRMAVGASRADIRLQFLAETLVLCVLGGVGGAIFGLAVALIGSAFALLDIELSILPFLLTVGTASLVGILAGTIPAVRASNIQPGIAIKQE